MIDFSKYGTAIGSGTPLQGKPMTPEEINFSKYGSPTQAPLVPPKDENIHAGMSKTFGLDKMQPKQDMGVGDYVDKFLGEPARALGKTFSEYPGKIADDVKAGAQDIQKGDVLKGITKSGARIAGDTAGAVFAAPGALVESGKNMAGTVGNAIDPNFTKNLDRGVQGVGDAIGNNPIVQEFAMKHPNAAEDFSRALNLLFAKGETGEINPTRMAGEMKALPGTIKGDIAPPGGSGGLKQAITDTGAKIKETIVDPVVRNLMESSQKNINNKILKDYQKGVKPTILGKQTAGKADSYNQKVVSSVNSIVDNAPNIKYNLEDGSTEGGRAPQTLNEFSQAISQTKKGIFEKYDNLAKQAGENGAVIETKPIASELDSVINNKALKIANPKAIDYAENLKHRLEIAGDLDTKTTQDVIEAYNKSLEAYYRNPSYDTATQAGIDALVANKFRESLDSKIEKTSGDGYQELKNQYGALKTIEKDVVKRDLMEARKNIKGLIDYSDIASGADLASGLLTMSPVTFARGLAMKGIASYIKFKNSPNQAIKSMFERASESRSTKSGSQTTPTEGQTLPPTEPLAPTESSKLDSSKNNTPLSNNNQEGAVDNLKSSKKGSPAMGEIATDKTSKAFLKSSGQEVIGKLDDKDLSIGSFGKNAIERKTAGGQEDRLPISEIKDTLPYVTGESYKAGDSSFRKDNVVHIAEMPNGEKRALITRENSSGQREVVNIFKIGRDYQKFVDNLKQYGIPAGTRTQMTSLEPKQSDPLTYRDTTNVSQNNYSDKGSLSTGPKGGSKEIPNKQGGFIQAYKEKGPVTTKILKDLEGKTTVSKQYIMDATNRGDVKQVEKDLIRGLLENEGKDVNVAEFADKVKAELLPLKRNDAGSAFEQVNLPDNIRGDVENYKAHIYSSPIKTSAGDIHFGEGEPGSKNYFGHTRVEDVVTGMNKETDTRRVLEVQSDLYQKGNLDKEVGNGYDFERLAELEAKKKAGESYSKSDLTNLQAIKKEFEKNPSKNPLILKQYSNPSAHFRMVREEVKQAAKDGITRLQFPTGETAMKIEGLGENRHWFSPESFGEGLPIHSDYLKVGKEILSPTEDRWIVTDVLGDGKFKAVPKSVYDKVAETGIKPPLFNSSQETFDISGRVDTNNPIYRFYEKDLGRYLKNKYDAKLVTDKQGVSWMEVPINKKMAKEPVEAFGKIGISPLTGGAIVGLGLAALSKIGEKKKK